MRAGQAHQHNVIDLGILAEAHLEGAYHFKDNDKLER